MGILIHHGGWWSRISPWERSYRFVSSERRCSSKQTFKDCYMSNFSVGCWILIHHGSVLPVYVVWAPVFLKANFPNFNVGWWIRIHHGGVNLPVCLVSRSQRRCSSKQTFKVIDYISNFNVGGGGGGNSNSPWGIEVEFTMGAFYWLCASQRRFPQSKLSKLLYFKFQRGEISNSPWERLTSVSNSRLSTDCFISSFNGGGEFEFTMGDGELPIWPGLRMSVNSSKRTFSACYGPEGI